MGTKRSSSMLDEGSNLKDKPSPTNLEGKSSHSTLANGSDQENEPPVTCLEAKRTFPTASDCPYFVSTVKPCKWPYLSVPVEFARSNGLNKRCCELILIDSSERSWTVELVPKATQVIIRSGWGKFLNESGLKEGDTFKLELIKKGDKPIMKFHVMARGTTRYPHLTRLSRSHADVATSLSQASSCSGSQESLSNPVLSLGQSQHLSDIHMHDEDVGVDIGGTPSSSHPHQSAQPASLGRVENLSDIQMPDEDANRDMSDTLSSSHPRQSTWSKSSGRAEGTAHWQGFGFHSIDAYTAWLADGRTHVRLYDNGFVPSATIRELKNILVDGYNDAWTSYKEIPLDIKERWFRSFEKDYKWYPCESQRIKRCFQFKIGERITDQLYKARRYNKKPNWTTEETWQQMKIKWRDPKWQSIARKNKDNRLKSPSVHYTGSTPFHEIKRRMEEREGRQVTQAEVFLFAHRKGEGHNAQYSDPKAAETIERYNELLEQCEFVSQVDPTTSSVNPDQVFFKAVGGAKKGRVYGHGSQGIRIGGAAHDVPTVAPSLTKRDADAVVTQATDTLKHRLKEQQQRTVQEQLEQQRQTWVEQQQHMMAEQQREMQRQMQDQLLLMRQQYEEEMRQMREQISALRDSFPPCQLDQQGDPS